MVLTLRPHHVLCRLGFQGYGYSPEYISEMGRIVKIISSGRVKSIIVRPGFDNVCRSCPHSPPIISAPGANPPRILTTARLGH